MKMRTAAILCGFAAAALSVYAADVPPSRPKAGKVEIMPLDQVKPGMQATAWTVFQGTEAEPIPVEIVGRWKNQLGPRQDVILAKLRWLADAGSASERQWQDVLGVMKVQGERLDLAYMRQWAASLGVLPLLERALGDAGRPDD